MMPLSWAAASPAQMPRAISSPLSTGRPPDAAQQQGEVLAVHVFHDQEVVGVGFHDVVQAAYVGMGDLTAEAYLVDQVLETLRVLGQRRGQELERDRLAEPPVVRVVDLAHASLAQQRHHLIAAGEQRPGSEAVIGAARPRRRPQRRLLDLGVGLVDLGVGLTAWGDGLADLGVGLARFPRGGHRQSPEGALGAYHTYSPLAACERGADLSLHRAAGGRSIGPRRNPGCARIPLQTVVVDVTLGRVPCDESRPAAPSSSRRS
jgi:hypothetical protein